MKRVFIIVSLVALVLAACATDSGSPDASEELPMDQSSDSHSASSPAGDEPIPVEPNEGIDDGADGSLLPVIMPELSDEVEAAVEDLRTLLGDDVVIEVLVAHEVTWPDRSLGCPDPDMSYSQVLVDGYRIELGSGDRVFPYHGEVGQDPFLCLMAVDGVNASDLVPVEGAVSPADPGSDTASRRPIDASLAGLVDEALRDLAQRRGSSEGIRVVSAESVVWPDGSLGCPREGMEYRQVQVDGSRIVLSADGVTWSYHSGGDRALFLCEGAK